MSEPTPLERWAESMGVAELRAARRLDEAYKAAVEAPLLARIVALESSVAAARHEAESLRDALSLAAGRFRGFAAHCRDSCWHNLAAEFDAFAADAEGSAAPSAAPDAKGADDE